MERKQIYLSKAQIQSLVRLAGHTDENISSLIRQAIDRFIEAQEKMKNNKKKRSAEFRKALRAVAGIWADRDPKEFEEIRRSADRRLDEWGV